MGEAEVPKRTGKLPDFDKLWDYAHPEISEQRFRELLPRALDSLDLSYLAQLLTQIARAEGLQRKFEDAHKTLDRVDKALPKTDGRTLIRYLLERGRVYNSSGGVEDAKRLFLQAFDLAVKSKEDFYAVDAAHMVAIVESPENQLEWTLKALDLAENSLDERARNWKGSLCNNIGWTYPSSFSPFHPGNSRPDPELSDSTPTGSPAIRQSPPCEQHPPRKNPPST